jgi:UDP-2,3-diacylglucosamine hydrolase
MTHTAVIAGTGALPALLAAALEAAGDTVLLAEMEGFPAAVPGHRAIRFRIERLAPFLDHLVDAGVARVIMAGAMRRPKLDPELFDARTATLVPRLLKAIHAGDDGALREVISIFEEWDLKVVGAHEVLPGLLPQAGVLTRAAPMPQHHADAIAGEAAVAQMGAEDGGQACVIESGRIVAREGPDGTDAMLASLNPTAAPAGILFKAPKPAQDRRADLPVIGPDTADRAVAAGLAGIVIEAGGVMVIDLPRVRDTLDALGVFLWVRPEGLP